MSLTLYYHPLSSYCFKTLIALYENATPFTPLLVNLGEPESRNAFLKVWPVGKFPVLRDDARNLTVPESSIIIEYLAQHYPGPSKLVPTDPDLARQVRMRDRFYDLHIHSHMQRIIGERIRPADKKDPFGADQARAAMNTALGMTDHEMQNKQWAVGDSFTMADCAAAPALFYANKIEALDGPYPHVAAYLKRLTERPSFARTLKEAEPYFHMFPT